MTRVILTNANLIDGTNPAVPDSSIVVEDNRVASVTTDQVAVESGDTVIDCGGRTVMPGMVSGHFHSTYRDVMPPFVIPLGLERAPAYHAYIAADNARLAIEAGVTSVVGANEAFDIDPSLRDAIDDGVLVGPRVVPGSRDLITTADSNDTTPWWWEARAVSALRICDGPDEFRRGVREEIRRGAEIVKLYATGGHGVRLGADTASLTKAELGAAVEAAHGLGKRARAHVSSKSSIMACLEAGIDVIDHGDGLDEECIEAMVETNAILLPSLPGGAWALETFGDSEPLDAEIGQLVHAFHSMCEILPAVVEAGVRICLGDDYGGRPLPHGSYGKELELCVKYAAVSPLEAVRWATVNGGALVGLEDLGSIEEGMLADMIIVNGDPSSDIAVLGEVENVLLVMRDGKVLVDRLG